MVNTEKQIQNTFLKLIDKYDIDEIDVFTICKQLDIKRQTFYYHYKNIYDVVYSIYLDKRINEPFNQNDLNAISRNVFSFLFKDQSFNLLVLKSSAADVLKNFLVSYVFNLILLVLQNYNLKLNEKKEIARFYSKAIIEQCLYLFEKEEVSINEGVERMLLLFNDDVLKVSVRRYQNSIE